MSSVSFAHLSHEKRGTFARPAAASPAENAWSLKSLLMACSAETSLRGSKYAAVCPRISRATGISELATGKPDAWASIMGRPNPSNKDGFTRQEAPWYKACRFSEETRPVATMLLEFRIEYISSFTKG